jgi:hypothetical protein
MGKLLKALKFVKLVPDVIDFITAAVEAFKDRRLTLPEMADLAEKGENILEKLT